MGVVAVELRDGVEDPPDDLVPVVIGFLDDLRERDLVS